MPRLLQCPPRPLTITSSKGGLAMDDFIGQKANYLPPMMMVGQQTVWHCIVYVQSNITVM